MQRRTFLSQVSIAGAGWCIAPALQSVFPGNSSGKKLGIIGLDTSHSVAFTKALNGAKDVSDYNGYKIVSAYPFGSRTIQSSFSRIEGYTREVETLGVKIAGSIPELLDQVDGVLLETNDGRLHLEQARLVIEAGKPLFIDKPVAADFKSVVAIYKLAEQYRVPLFSSSSLRFIDGMEQVHSGSIGKVTGADVFSPAIKEPSHPDLYWYGIHGVEMLFTIMGTGCRSVKRISGNETDIVTGTWEDGRIGVFRGTRTGAQEFGGTVHGEKGVLHLGKFTGYERLLQRIIRFFETGVAPVASVVTMELYAFMSAADLSKKRNGKTVLLKEVYAKAKG